MGKVMEIKNHYVYLLSSKITMMYYIGVRTCSCPISEDTYMGSSTVMTQADKANCNKIILKRFSSRREAMQYEIELHEKFDVAKSFEFWNLAKSTTTGFDMTGVKKGPQSTEQKLAHSQRMTGRSCSNETKEKMSKAHKGKVHSKDAKEKMSVSKQGLKNPRFGKPHTEESKQNLSKKLKGGTAPRLVCPHCNKEGGKGAMLRWHFNNCKVRSNNDSK